MSDVTVSVTCGWRDGEVMLEKMFASRIREGVVCVLWQLEGIASGTVTLFWCGEENVRIRVFGAAMRTDNRSR